MLLKMQMPVMILVVEWKFIYVCSKWFGWFQLLQHILLCSWSFHLLSLPLQQNDRFLVNFLPLVLMKLEPSHIHLAACIIHCPFWELVGRSGYDRLRDSSFEPIWFSFHSSYWDYGWYWYKLPNAIESIHFTDAWSQTKEVIPVVFPIQSI